jgi:eukaryotic-like serine/threonine-protein kinase
VNQLRGTYPTDTVISSLMAPLVQSEIEKRRGNLAEASRLSETLRSYDRGLVMGLTDNYVRGHVFLEQRKSDEAAAEFQKIIDSPAIDPFSPVHALAHLCLGRAAVLKGDTAAARKAYQDFFALWKDADQDLPVLVEARKEYDGLK